MKKIIKEKTINTIHKLRQRPEEERRHLLHIFMFIAVILLFVLWAFSLGAGNVKQKEAKVKQDRKGLETFSVLKENIVSGFESIKADTSEIVER